MQLKIDKNNYKIAKRYADALVLIANEKNLLDNFYNDLLNVFEVYQNSSDFKSLMISPNFEKNRKKEVIKQIFENKINDFILNFLFVLIDSKHFDIFETILYCYKEGIDKTKNIENVFITSSIDLKDEFKNRIQNKLKEKMKKEVRISYLKDEGILGGLIISTEEKVIDLSLKKKFNKIEKELI